MAGLSIVGFVVIGVVAFNAVSLLPQVPQASAAWGWEMTVPTESLGFTCSEGATLGCPYGSNLEVNGVTCTAGSETSCPASCFACTVTPVAGKTCDVTSTAVQCTKDGETIMPSSQSGTWMCINNGMDGHPANGAQLSWSSAPSCSDTGGTGTSGAEHAAVPATLALGMAAAILA